MAVPAGLYVVWMLDVGWSPKIPVARYVFTFVDEAIPLVSLNADLQKVEDEYKYVVLDMLLSFFVLPIHRQFQLF